MKVTAVTLIVLVIILFQPFLASNGFHSSSFSGSGLLSDGEHIMRDSPPLITLMQTITPTVTLTPTQVITPTVTLTPTQVITPTIPLPPAGLCAPLPWIIAAVIILILLSLGGIVSFWIRRSEQARRQPVSRQDLHILTYDGGVKNKDGELELLLDRFFPSLESYDNQVIYGGPELRTLFLMRFTDEINRSFQNTGELAVYLSLASLLTKDVYLSSSAAMSLLELLMLQLFQVLTELVPSTLPQYSTIQRLSAKLRSVPFRPDTLDTTALLNLLGQLCETLNIKSLVVVLDEWSAIREDVQPMLAELLRRMFASGGLVTLKIGGERQHTHLYGIRGRNVWGLQIGVDIYPGADLGQSAQSGW